MLVFCQKYKNNDGINPGRKEQEFINNNIKEAEKLKEGKNDNINGREQIIE